ncbi:patatin-like phospholipase family protein [Aquabacterium sp. CECT 9606]|uniref:patatin-like phospholipase family protein n=1 Tax=Aquabacterium sp. CECT 9606 TaxID=2845822 RepID=UPI001E52304D|nr:patatin-like phospholipase family protein [Aquabacterium sp. CECT 9606]
MNFAYAPVEYAAKRVLCATLIVALAACGSTPPAPAPEVKAPVLAPVVKPAAKPPRIGLALGGGAARGFAHIGVLQVLEEQGIKPDLVVGTSAGSLVAAIYAAGKTPGELESMAMNLDESTMTDWVFPGRSVMKGEALAKFVRGFTAGRQIEQMALPLGIVATDLNSGQPILFRRGDPGTAVRASSSVPAVFAPVRIAGREYVDGGLVSPIPVKYARQMGADLVIAVDISAIPEGQPTKGAVDILLQTFNIMGHSISQYELQDADVVMRPRLSGIGGGDFGNRRLSILAGREAALSVLQQLKEKIAAKTR